MERQILDYLKLVAKCRIKILVPALVICVLLVGYFVRVAPTKFTAQAKLYVASASSSHSSEDILFSAALGGSDQQQFLASQPALVKSYVLYSRVRQRQGKPIEDVVAPEEKMNLIWRMQALLFGDDYVNARMRFKREDFLVFQGAVDIKTDEAGANLTLSYSAKSPEEALETVRLVADALVDVNGDIASETARRSSEVLKAKVDAARREVEESDRVISKHISENDFPNDEFQIRARYDLYQSLQSQIATANLELEKATETLAKTRQYQREIEENFRQATVDLSNSRAMVIDTRIKAVEMDILTLKITGAKAKIGPLEEQLAFLKGELEAVTSSRNTVLSAERYEQTVADLDTTSRNLEVAISVVSRQLGTLRARADKALEAIKILPAQRAELSKLMVTHTQKLKILEMITQAHLNALLQADIALTRLHLIDEPMLTLNAGAMSKLQLFAILVVLALIACVCVVGLYDYVVGTIMSRSQLNRQRGVTYLGAISHFEKLRKGINIPRLKMDEAVSRISYQLNRYAKPVGEGLGHVIVTSSSKSLAGKSVSALAMALGVDARGSRVCLIDCDHRAKQRNVMSYISESSAGGNLLVFPDASSIANADVIPGHPVVVSPLIHRDLSLQSAKDYLEGEFPAVLERLRRRFDYIFLDSPPLDFTEALVLVNQADSILLCVPEGSMTEGEVQGAFETIEVHRAPNATIYSVITNSRLRENQISMNYRHYQSRVRAA